MSQLARVEAAFLARLDALAEAPAAPGPADGPLVPGSALTRARAVELFESQVASRLLDHAARELRAKKQGFYTIGSAGHEGNVVLGALTRATDPALLHYRSGALFCERARQAPEVDAIADVLASLAAAADEPAAGGRHKVWGSSPLAIIPQTSTIASHLPKAVGLALAVERARALHRATPWPADALVLCSFGDASVNHATALAGFNAASYIAERGLRLPLLFVCEDNGWGISVRTPPGGVSRVIGRLPGVRVFTADGLDLVAAWDGAAAAVDYVRTRRKPAVLHLTCVRLFGHAGSDIESTYRDAADIAADEARDPIPASATRLVEGGAATAADLRARYLALRARVAAAAAEVVRRPKLTSAAAIVAPLAPHSAAAVAAEATRAPDPDARARVFGPAGLPEAHGKPRHLAQLLSWALADAAAKYRQLLVFGEDVGRKGGVYHVTADLQARVGRGRVFDTLLDETTILGLSIGAGLAGFLPVPEIQYLAYVHNALDQLRGEACSQQFFSNGAYRNPMVVRIAAFAYQEGFGGHFHNDNSVAALRDIPGLVVAAPARGDDAVGMLRTALAAAAVDGRVVAYLEPIALYHQKDRYAPDDGGWCFDYPAWGAVVPLGQARVYGTDGGDEPSPPDTDRAEAVIVTYANGSRLSLQAARKSRRRVRIVDLRWLQPLDADTLCREAAAAGRVLVVDEGRRSGGVAEPVMALLAERVPGVRLSRVTGEDTYIPLGDAWRLVLPSVERIGEALAALLG